MPTNFSIGDEVHYILNMATHWEARGPAKLVRFKGSNGFAVLSDSIATAIDTKYLYHSLEQAVMASREMNQQLRR